MNVERVQYLIIISVSFTSCLLHALLVKKLLLSELGKIFSPRLIVSSILYIITSIAIIILSAYLIIYVTYSGMFAAINFEMRFLTAFSCLFACVESFSVDERVERFVKRKRATRRAFARSRLSNFLR